MPRSKKHKPEPRLKFTAREVYEAYVIRHGSKGKAPKEDDGLPRKNSAILGLSRTLFKEQIDFIKDGHKKKAAICSRRSGKSYAAGRYLIQEAMDKEGSMAVYIARTREAAKRILWATLKKANQDYRLGIKFNNADLIATFPNSSQILFTGANDASDVDKLRGAAFSLAVLDEAAFFNIDLKELVNEVLTPALLDLDGSLVMISTPSAACRGFFYKVTEKGGFGFSVHKWTIRDNPYMQHAVKSIDNDIQSGILNANDAAYKREYLGLWARDDQDMVYTASTSNIIDKLPESQEWEYVLSVDLGYNDPTAFIVSCWSEDHPYFFIVDEYKQSKMMVYDVEAKIERFCSDYNIHKVIMDTGGGASRMVLETFKERTSLALTPAKKTQDKVGMIRMMNSDIASGLVKVLGCPMLLDEWGKLQYNRAGTAEDKRHDNHLADAALYAWTDSRHFLHEEKSLPPAFGTDEYWKKYEDELEERLMQEEEMKDSENEYLWGDSYSETELWQ